MYALEGWVANNILNKFVIKFYVIVVTNLLNVIMLQNLTVVFNDSTFTNVVGQQC